MMAVIGGGGLKGSKIGEEVGGVGLSGENRGQQKLVCCTQYFPFTTVQETILVVMAATVAVAVECALAFPHLRYC